MFLIRWKTITMFLYRILLGSIDFVILYEFEDRISRKITIKTTLDRRNVQTKLNVHQFVNVVPFSIDVICTLFTCSNLCTI